MLAIDSYPPPLVGGHALHVCMLAGELTDRGHEVEILSLAGPSGAKTEMDGNVRVHRVQGWSRLYNRFSANPGRTVHPTVRDPALVRRFKDLIEAFQPDIVHAHGWILYSLLPFLPSTKTRLVVTMHEYGLVCPKNSFVHKQATCDGPGLAKCLVCSREQYGTMLAGALTIGMATSSRSISRVNRFIAVSTAVTRACSSLIDERLVEVIPPFISDASLQIDDCDRPEFVPAIGDYVMFAGALAPHKGVDVLLEAWAGSKVEIPLVLVGLRSQHDFDVRQKNVVLAENVPHDDVLRAWRHCSVAVVPSRWPEPAGTVSMEAMAAGCPVVASSVGGLPEIVEDGVTGILVPPGDADALRGTVEGLLADPARRSQMGLAGRLRAAQFCAGKIVPRIERVYGEALSAPATL